MYLPQQIIIPRPAPYYINQSGYYPEIIEAWDNLRSHPPGAPQRVISIGNQSRIGPPTTSSTPYRAQPSRVIPQSSRVDPRSSSVDPQSKGDWRQDYGRATNVTRRSNASSSAGTYTAPKSTERFATINQHHRTNLSSNFCPKF